MEKYARILARLIFGYGFGCYIRIFSVSGYLW